MAVTMQDIDLSCIFRGSLEGAATCSALPWFNAYVIAYFVELGEI
jgi:hypothetical protein